MEEVTNLIKSIREFTEIERKKTNLRGLDYFFISMLEISCNLSELGVFQSREITKEEEENWFKGSYHLDFWDSEINNKYYIPLCKIIEQLKFFR